MKQTRFATECDLAPEAATNESASSSQPAVGGHHAPAAAPPGLDFEPVALRYRTDGWTPARQREYVEALADTGVARQAAALVGMTEQSVSRLRRRADARGFDLACEAAMRIGARQLRSVAFQRAIEGTIKRHHYHGEVKSEEVVYDNRLLIYLLGRTEKWLEPPAESLAVAADWELWMEAVEQGRSAPLAPSPALTEAAAETEPEHDPPAEPEPYFTVSQEDVWEESDGSGWWTVFPPPAGFDGVETGPWGEEGYERTLTAEEEAAVKAAREEEMLVRMRGEIERRDWYFGFAGGNDEVDLARDEGEEEEEGEGEEEDEVEEKSAEAGGDGSGPGEGKVFPSKEAEPYEPSAPSAPESAEPAGLRTAPEAAPAQPEPPGPRIRML